MPPTGYCVSSSGPKRPSFFTKNICPTFSSRLIVWILSCIRTSSTVICASEVVCVSSPAVCSVVTGTCVVAVSSVSPGSDEVRSPSRRRFPEPKIPKNTIQMINIPYIIFLCRCIIEHDSVLFIIITISPFFELVIIIIHYI